MTKLLSLAWRLIFVMSLISSAYLSNCQDFQNYYGLSSEDEFKTIVAIPNSPDYVVAGSTSTAGVTNTSDIYIARMNQQGQVLWSRTFGGNGDDAALTSTINVNGNIVIAGTSNSFNGLASDWDILVFEIEPSAGTIIWSKTYGLPGLNDTPNKINKTQTGLAIAGLTVTPGSNIPSYIAMELSFNGSVINWQNKISSSSGGSIGYSIIPSKQVGYLFVGGTYNGSSYDQVLLKLNPQGKIMNQAVFGSSNNENAHDVIELPTLEVVVMGNYREVSGPGLEFSLTKLSPALGFVWSKTYGDAGPANERAFSFIQTQTGYALAGFTDGFGMGQSDMLVVRTDMNGDMAGNPSSDFGGTNTDQAFGIIQNPDKSFTIIGSSNSFGAGGKDAALINTDPNGMVPGNCAFANVIQRNLTSSVMLPPFNNLTESNPNFTITPVALTSGTVSFNVIKGLPISIAGPTQVCQGKSYTYTVNSPSAIPSYSISPAGVASIESQTPTSVTIKAVGIGNFTLTATAVGECASLGVTINASPQVSITGLQTEYCSGDYDVTLTGNPFGGTFTVDGVIASTFVPTAVGSHTITYTFVNALGCSNSETRVVTVKECCQYQIGTTPAICGDYSTPICIPITATYPVSRGIIGMDLCVKYDPTILSANGTFTLGPVVAQNNPTWSSAYINTQEPGVVRVSIYFTSNAPTGSQFKGAGDVICLGFKLLSGAGGTESPITSCELSESYLLSEKNACIQSGKVIVVYDNILKGKLIYQNNIGKSLGMAYPISDPNNAITQITLTDDNCVSQTNPPSMVDANGNFSIPLFGTFNKVKINRDIKMVPNTYVDMKYINGFDAFQMGNITTKRTSGNYYYTPTPYMMIAADVNMNGLVRANDITLVMQRIVKKINEYPQVWNSGTSPQLPSLDWRFVDFQQAQADPSFIISSAFPESDNVGYYRDNVPDVSGCYSFTPQCKNDQNIYSGILLGDVYDGGPGFPSYPNSGDPYIKTTAGTFAPVVLDVNAFEPIGNNLYRVYVKHNFGKNDIIVSFDFGVDYNESAISIVDVKATPEFLSSGGQVEWNDYNKSELLLTSYTLSNFPSSGNLFYIDIYKANGKPTAADFGTSFSYVNGVEAKTSINVSNGLDVNSTISIVPNPASEQATISYSSTNAISKIEIINNVGVRIAQFEGISGEGQICFNVNDLPKGMYHCVMSSEGNGKTVAKLIVY